MSYTFIVVNWPLILFTFWIFIKYYLKLKVPLYLMGHVLLIWSPGSRPCNEDLMQFRRYREQQGNSNWSREEKVTNQRCLVSQLPE